MAASALPAPAPRLVVTGDWSFSVWTSYPEYGSIRVNVRRHDADGHVVETHALDGVYPADQEPVVRQAALDAGILAVHGGW